MNEEEEKKVPEAEEKGSAAPLPEAAAEAETVQESASADVTDKPEEPNAEAAGAEENPEEAKSAPEEKAEETASKLDENAEAAKAEEKKVCDIWPDAAENVAASPVWCVSSVKNQLYFEHYFLEIGGSCYYVQICCPENDSKAMEDMRKLFYGVEFGLEYSGKNVAGE